MIFLGFWGGLFGGNFGKVGGSDIHCPKKITPT
jgi:hypothetical protein